MRKLRDRGINFNMDAAVLTRAGWPSKYGENLNLELIGMLAS